MDQNKKTCPEYLIAGASKTGTEWLRMCLRQHSEVYIPDGPTIDYFSKHYEKDENWYLTHFDNAKRNDTIVEKSTSYMVYKSSCKRIYDINPNMEFIFILRDPIERAYSHYCMHLKAGKVTRKVSQELRKGTRYVDEGFYYNHIKRFEKFFGRENINIFLFDNLKSNPEEFWRGVLSALGVNEDIVPKTVKAKYHSRKSLPKYKNLYRTLVSVNRHIRSKSKIYNSFFIWLNQIGATSLFHYYIPSEEFPPLKHKDRLRLKNVYESDYVKLRKYIDKDISSWMNLS